MEREKVKGFLISESESLASTPSIISDKSGSPTIIETVLQEGDIENRNKRIYPTSVIKNGLAGEYVQERLSTGSWYGESGKEIAELIRNN